MRVQGGKTTEKEVKGFTMQELIERPKQKLAVALGYFDGVHHGHRRVLCAAIDEAKRRGLQSGVFTFLLSERHQIKGKALLSPDERRRRIAALGMDWYYCPCYEDFYRFSPEEYVQHVLIDTMNATAVFCGDNFTFGSGRQGNVPMLTRLCRQHGISVTVVPMAWQGGELVSSTRIRDLLLAGHMQQVNELLGAPYAIEAEVVHGKHLGSRLGFPTINQKYQPGMLLPGSGIYLGRAQVDGKWYPAATGLGPQPTVGGTDITCESFLVGYDGDLYGKVVRLEFLQYFAPILKFDTLDELKQYIADAAAAAKQYFDQNPPPAADVCTKT